MNMSFLPQDWSTVHHAYVVSGISSESLWEEMGRGLSFQRQANPDAYAREFDTLGIDEARELTSWAINKPLGKRKVAIISTEVFTSEAQNALLKLFEEPPVGTYFFVIVPNASVILPTLLSRVRVLAQSEEGESEKKLKLFLESPIAERLKMIAPLVKGKDKERARNLIRFLEKQISEMPNSEKKTNMAGKILESERFISTRGGSMKLILEYLAVSL
jgi:hypothetical protein